MAGMRIYDPIRKVEIPLTSLTQGSHNSHPNLDFLRPGKEAEELVALQIEQLSHIQNVNKS